MDTAVEELSQVEARTGRQVITSYNNGGERISIGSVRYRDYEGNRAVRHLMLESDLSGREHPLGSASSGFRTVSHADVLDPFLEAGYQPRSIMHARGGASMIAILGHPGFTYADPIKWDHALMDYETGTGLEASVRIKSDLRKGHGVVADVGFYRLICTNGLVAKILDLGHLQTNHRIFTSEQVEDFVSSVPNSPETMPQADSGLIEEVIRFLNTPEEDIPNLPRLLQTPVSKITNETNKATWISLHQNLEALMKQSDSFSKLDLINVQTNLAHSTRSPWSIYRETDTMTSALVDLVELAGVRKGVATFSPN